MEKQSLEDILIESKKTIFFTRFNKVNRKLWYGIGIITLIYLIIFLFKSSDSTGEDIISGVIRTVFFVPFGVFFPAIFIGMIPLVNWEYGTRVYRIFLIILLIVHIIRTVFLIIPKGIA